MKKPNRDPLNGIGTITEDELAAAALSIYYLGGPETYQDDVTPIIQRWKQERRRKAKC